MKIQSKLTVLGSVAALAVSPIALAGKAGNAAEPVEIAEPSEGIDPAVCYAGPDVVVEEPSEDSSAGEPGEEPTDDTITEPEDGDTTVELSDPVDGEPEATDDGTAVPIDWVKRGGGDNPEIFYNTAVGEPPVFKGETSPLTKELGQDEKATDIEGKDNAVVPQIEREKKGPVALIKKGRVFLR